MEIFNTIVEAYVDQGEPIGSKTLSEKIGQTLSSATIRNIMSNLEEAGLLCSPHTSAGRIPTAKGLRFFVDGLLEERELTQSEKKQLEQLAKSKNQKLDSILTKTTHILSGLSHCASLVLAPKVEHFHINHIEFLALTEQKGLVILVSTEGVVENRIINLPDGVTISQLQSASRFINSYLSEHTLEESIKIIKKDLAKERCHLDELSHNLIKEGLAIGQACGEDAGSIIVRGQSQLLQNISNLEELDSIRELFSTLERKETASQLIEASLGAQGVKIFIGSEHELFKKSGYSVIVSPYKSESQKTIGLIGIIGPMHVNYRRVIPMVNYSAKLISKLLGSEE